MSNTSTHREIERKFLIKHLPPGFGKLKAMPIEQGYLVQADTREIRLRQQGQSWHLTVKDGAGLQRQETDIQLTKEQATALWPMTHGRRIIKTRFVYPYLSYRLEIDIFSGNLDPLRLCEIEFASMAEAEAFKAPEFLGAEVTESPEYKNANLALHGLPNGDKVKERYGTLPFLAKDDDLYVVLVTNQSGNKWIFPRGQLELDMTPAEAALMESYEEAGLIGRVLSELRGQCTRDDGSIHHLYPMKVIQMLDEWPEDSIRKRQVVKFKKAMQMLDDPEMIKCAQALVARIAL
jgi:adenylate cyclase